MREPAEDLDSEVLEKGDDVVDEEPMNIELRHIKFVTSLQDLEDLVAVLKDDYEARGLVHCSKCALLLVESNDGWAVHDKNDPFAW